MGYLYNMDVIISESQLRFLIEGKAPTPEDIINAAKKHTIKQEFRYSNPREYDKAKRMGKEFLKSVTSHMTDKSFKWNNPKKIESEAKKYKTRLDFLKKSGGAYNAARRLGPCYDKTTGEEVVCGKFIGNSYVSSKNITNTLRFYNSITSHMTAPDYGPKMVYSYTFFDEENKVVGVYVGITNDEERRKGEHLTGKSTFTDTEVYSAVGNFIKENPTFKVEYTKLTEYIPFVEAQVKEKECMDNAKSNGYNVLNIAKTGGGGKIIFPDKYLIDKVNDWIKMKELKGEIPYFSEYNTSKGNVYSTIIRREKKDPTIYDKALKGLIMTRNRPKKKSEDQTTPSV